jgi:hypothetical protein
MVEDMAQAILIPYLFVFGFEMDPESVAECRDAIEIQRKENRDVHRSHFFVNGSSDYDHGVVVRQARGASPRPVDQGEECSRL